MTSIQNMKHASSLTKNATTKNSNKLNWKLDDIFLGFQDPSDDGV